MPEALPRHGPPPLRLSPDVWHRNVAALGRIDPTLAEQIGGIEPAAAGWQIARTRDGQIGFQRTGTDGQLEWFGRTSLPGIRAEALLEQFDPGRGNVLMPGIGEGSEVVGLLARLGCHRAVFVWEPGTVEIGLALRLHDVHDALASERLVLLACPAETLAERLLDWLRAHPGHLCPERLMMWPWQTLAELAGLRAAVEAAYRGIQEERQSELQRLRATRANTAMPGSAAAMAILGLHAREEVWSCAQGLSEAVCGRGQTPIVSVLRAPGDVHPLAAARQLAGGPRPGRAILLEVSRRSVRHILDDQTPAVSWISPIAGVPADLSAQIGPHDHVAVTDHRLHEQAVAAGLAPDRLHLVPPACPALRAKGHPGRRQSVIALIADLPALAPEAYGIRLPTHVQLWRTALELIEAQIDGFRPDRLEALLARAEEKSGVTRIEPEIRQAMFQGLCGAAQALLCSFLVKGLRQTSRPLRIYGAGWTGPEADHPEPVTYERRIAIAHESWAVLHVDVTGSGTPEALLAAASGALLISFASSLDDAPGGLATLLRPIDEYVPFRTLRGLLQSLDRLQNNPESSGRIVSGAMMRCEQEHTPGRRLAALEAILSS